MIVNELMGGLGNQMFQYAIGRHLSIKYKTDLVLDRYFLLDRLPRKDFVYRNYDLSIFNVQEQFASVDISRKYGICKEPKRNIFHQLLTFNKLRYVREQGFEFKSEIINIGDNVYLHGYWQTEKYFKDIESIIRKDFTFKEGMGQRAIELKAKILATNAICLNVRRGDFVTNPMLGTVGIDYYISAVAYLKKQIFNPAIFIFSDEINWCRENLKLEGEVHFISHEYAGEKFRDYLELMMLCKYFIIPNSSFAWWAAWLCSHPYKIIIAPNVWFQNPNWNYKDIVPQGWIKM